MTVPVARYFLSYHKVIRTVNAFYKDYYDHYYDCPMSDFNLKIALGISKWRREREQKTQNIS